MADNTDFTPELTLTPDLNTAAASAEARAPEAPNLTLDPSTADAAVKQADQAARAANAVHLDESMLSEPERKMVADFAEKIDIKDSNVVLQYGAAAQKNIAGFSESALGKVRTKDLGEVGDALAGLVGELQNLASRRTRAASSASSRRRKTIFRL